MQTSFYIQDILSTPVISQNTESIRKKRKSYQPKRIEQYNQTIDSISSHSSHTISSTEETSSKESANASGLTDNIFHFLDQFSSTKSTNISNISSPKITLKSPKRGLRNIKSASMITDGSIQKVNDIESIRLKRKGRKVRETIYDKIRLKKECIDSKVVRNKKICNSFFRTAENDELKKKLYMYNSHFVLFFRTEQKKIMERSVNLMGHYNRLAMIECILKIKDAREQALINVKTKDAEEMIKSYYHQYINTKIIQLSYLMPEVAAAQQSTNVDDDELLNIAVQTIYNTSLALAQTNEYIEDKITNLYNNEKDIKLYTQNLISRIHLIQEKSNNTVQEIKDEKLNLSDSLAASSSSLDFEYNIADEIKIESPYNVKDQDINLSSTHV